MADNTFLVKLGINTQELVSGVNKANSTLSTFKSTMQGLTVGMGAIQIGRFVLDVSRLAGEAEGVSAAFKKLENSAKLMLDIKQATGGTVSELELMKRAVMASNFDISLKALPQLLEFATLRARQTGQSVDYLVDSIVTGIGRKSKLILDNLGISAVQLTEALGGASAASSTIGEVAEAVGRIATKNLKQMGSLTDDASVKVDRLSASWTNLKVQMGNIANNSGLSFAMDVITVMLGGANNALSDFYGKVMEFNSSGNNFNDGGEKIKASMQKLRDAAKKAGIEIHFLTDNATLATRAIINVPHPNYVWINGDEIKQEVRSVKFLQDQIKSLNEEISLSGSRSEISKYQAEIKELEKEIDVLLGKEEKMKKFAGVPFTGLRNDKDRLGGQDVRNRKNASEDTSKLISSIEKENLAGSMLIDEKAEKVAKKNKETLDELKGQAEQIGQTYARVGDEIGQGFGSAISGTMTFAQAMERMAASVIDSIEQIVLARMIEKSFEEGGPTPVAIALAAAGFGAVKALFNRIGRHSQISSGSTPSMAYNGGQYGGQQLVATVTGKQLNFVLSEQQRYDSRTSTTG